ncbi:MAG: DASS family sodium-coupled anion symporter [Acidobacteriota bacterium]
MDPLIRTRHQAVDVIETYSPAEQRFNRRRKTFGLFAGPLCFLVVLLAPGPVLSAPAHRLAAILALVVAFWITEAVPVAVTALLGPVLAVILGVAPASAVFAPFADPIVFLFIGSFILAEATYAHGLDRRIAYTALASPRVGASGGRLLVVYGVVNVVVSMWISNTATTAMLFPIGLSIITHLSGQPEGANPHFRRFAMLMMLMTAFGASLGGLATPIGTPANLIGIGMLRTLAGSRVGFLSWMVIGVPLTVVLFAVLAAWFWATGGRRLTLSAAGIQMMRDELKRLGPLSQGERNVMLAFGMAITLWLLPGVLGLLGLTNTTFARVYQAAVPEPVAAMVGAMLLFVLPVDWRGRRFTMSWEEAVRIDWGTVLLFGGGLALGSLAFSTGLADVLGRRVASWVPEHSSLVLTGLFTGLAVVLSEVTSNTASASMIVPVAIAVAEAAGVRPVEPAMGAVLGASVGFVLPISTPPNAIAYSSGHVPITAMVRYGLALDLVAFLAITVLVWTVVPHLL